MSLKIIQNGTPVDATKIWIGGNIQAECLRVWSTEANAWVYESATELTGTLPLTFRSDGTALIDYRIYGNTVDMPINLWTATGSQYQIDLKTPLKAGRAYTLTTFKEGIADGADRMYMYDSNNSRITDGVCEHSDGSRIYVTLTPNKDVWRVTVSSALTDVQRTLTEGDTPPDEYISPETTEVQSVGVRTENLWEWGNTSYRIDLTTPIAANTNLTYAVFKDGIANNAEGIYLYDANGSRILNAVCANTDGSRIYATVTPARDVHRIELSPMAADALRMLTEGGTPPDEYIPYGYKLPMVSRNNLIGGMPLVPTAVNAGTTYPGVTVIDPQAGKYTLSWTKVTATVAATMMIFTMTGTTSQQLAYVPTSPWTYTLPSGVDKLMIVASTSATDPTWEALGFKDLVLTTESTETPIYIGDTQLMQDEYVSYSEQAIYKRTENVMPPSEKQTIESNGMTLYADGEGRYYLTGRTNDAATFNIPLIKEFTIPSRADEGVCMFFNTFVNSNASFNFFYDNTRIDTWTMVTRNRITTTYSVMAGKICNKIQIYIPANVTLNDSISPAFTKGVRLPEYIPYLAPQSPPVPLPQLPTFSDADTVLDYEETPAPEEVWVKYHKK